MSTNAKVVTNRSRKEWRKEIKKLRRKRLRQAQAKERDLVKEKENTEKLRNPAYLTWLANQRVLELIAEEREEEERKEVNRQWLEYDQICMKKWDKLQTELAEIEEKQKQKELQIQKKFEEMKERARKIKEERERRALEHQRNQELIQQKIDEYITGSGPLPAELVATNDTNPDRPPCPFFSKTSSCRFGIKCSRNHSQPIVSETLLIPNFFTHIRLEQNKSTEYGNDLVLEFDEDEIYEAFQEFFDDVVPEFEKFGKIEQFRVCYNQEIHLRGHVYVQFEDSRDSIRAYRCMQGRYYAGRMINLEFCQISSWKAAICGLSFTNKCPKGRNCNFLHVFKNPKNRFPLLNKRNDDERNGSVRHQEKQLQQEKASWDDVEDRSRNEQRNWRWSESPERIEHLMKDSDEKDVMRRRTFDKKYSNLGNRRDKYENSDRGSEEKSSRKRNRSKSPRRRSRDRLYRGERSENRHLKSRDKSLNKRSERSPIEIRQIHRKSENSYATRQRSRSYNSDDSDITKINRRSSSREKSKKSKKSKNKSVKNDQNNKQSQGDKSDRKNRS